MSWPPGRGEEYGRRDFLPRSPGTVVEEGWWHGVVVSSEERPSRSHRTAGGLQVSDLFTYALRARRMTEDEEAVHEVMSG